MSKSAIIQEYEKKQMKKEVPIFHVGDTLAVKTRIIEGDKERFQTFTGTVIGRKGTGVAETFAMHRVAHGEGMERIFLLHSPRIAEIQVMKEGDVRRAKLYYLRGTSGKKAKVKGRVVARKKVKVAAVVEEPVIEEEIISPEAEVSSPEAEVSAAVEQPVAEEVTSPEAELSAAAEEPSSEEPESSKE
jgi:large subunit ribosomal protein L19